MTIEIGHTVEGTVVKVADYGAIVRLAGGKMGLVHVSEVANTYVRDVREHVKENDRIVVKVLRVNQKGRYELSAKQAEVSVNEAKVEEPPPRPSAPVIDKSPPLVEHQRPKPPPEQQCRPATFEDKLTKFMKDSQERLLDIKRNVDIKRGLRRK